MLVVWEPGSGSHGFSPRSPSAAAVSLCRGRAPATVQAAFPAGRCMASREIPSPDRPALSRAAADGILISMNSYQTISRRVSSLGASRRGGFLPLASIVVAVLASACASAPPQAPSPAETAPAPTVAQVVDSIANTPPLHRTHWGVRVYDADEQRVLFDHQGSRHFIPASNNKLVVTLVALGELGPDYRYRTPIYALGGSAESGVYSELVVEGRGDPTLSERFHDSEMAALDSLADSVWIAGVRHVTGDLVVDASYFDAALVHGTWEVGDLDGYYAAPVSAFGVAEGAIAISIGPGAAAGEPATAEVVEPAGRVVLRNDLVTGEADSGRRWNYSRVPGTDSLHLTGRVPVDRSPGIVWATPADPTMHAAASFARALAERGIRIEGEVRVVYDSFESPVRDDGLLGTPAPIVTWSSPPMSEIVAAILKPSQNWIAEHVLKTLGAERGAGGTWSDGVDVELRYLYEVAGVDSGAVQLRDASGLSAQNLLTPEAVIRIFEHARRQPWGRIYRSAMAEPGESGTLRGRLEEFSGQLHGKTGTITNVNSLSGYLTTADGRELMFSVLSNGSGVSSGLVRAAIDRIVAAIGANPPIMAADQTSTASTGEAR